MMTNKARSEFAVVVIRANPGWPGLVDHAQSRYMANGRGHCVIIKNVILMLLSQQTTPSKVHGRDFAWPPLVATFLLNFQMCQN